MHFQVMKGFCWNSLESWTWNDIHPNKSGGRVLYQCVMKRAIFRSLKNLDGRKLLKNDPQNCEYSSLPSMVMWRHADSVLHIIYGSLSTMNNNDDNMIYMYAYVHLCFIYMRLHICIYKIFIHDFMSPMVHDCILDFIFTSFLVTGGRAVTHHPLVVRKLPACGRPPLQYILLLFTHWQLELC